MKWFRFYHEALHDAKVQTLSADLFRAWINILCLASEADDRGILPPMSQIAFSLRIKEEKAKQIIDQLIKARLIDETEDGSMSPHNWAARQPETDSSAGRVQRYRQRIRDKGETVTGYTKHRDEVFSRDGKQCVYCSATKTLVLDHLVPVVRGGTGTPDNLVTACKACNSGKAGRLVEEAGYTFISPDTLSLYEAAKTRFGVTVTDSMKSGNGKHLSPPVTVTVTPVTSLEAEEIRLEEKREEVAAVAGENAELPQEAEDAISEARIRYGDSVADLFRREAKAINRGLGGRYDLFLEALGAASSQRPRLPDRAVFSWCMQRARAKINQPAKAFAAGRPSKAAPNSYDAILAEMED